MTKFLEAFDYSDNSDDFDYCDNSDDSDDSDESLLVSVHVPLYLSILYETKISPTILYCKQKGNCASCSSSRIPYNTLVFVKIMFE